MIVSQVHRPYIESHPLGQIQWYKEFADHADIHGSGDWVPEMYVVLVVTKGNGYFIREKKEMAFAAGDLITLFPGFAQGLRANGEGGFSLALVSFSGPVFDLWKNTNMLDVNTPILSLGDASEWASRLLAIPLEDKQLGAERDLREICRLQQFFSEVRSSVQKKHDTQSDWSGKVEGKMRKYIGKELNLHELASEMNLSYDVFRRRFRSIIGMPPKKFFNRMVTESACSMLAETRLSSREISDRLGFCDEFYFSRFLKKNLGMSPREYRKRYM